ncbi:MAG: hypothetical protein ACLRWQ_16820 [Flavonifractor plautii]
MTATIGAATVLMPFGGRTQRTPAQVMAALLPVLPGQETDLCQRDGLGLRTRTAMVRDPYQRCSWPWWTSVAKLVAAGCRLPQGLSHLPGVL